jgi:hypothetical protein
MCENANDTLVLFGILVGFLFLAPSIIDAIREAVQKAKRAE